MTQQRSFDFGAPQTRDTSRRNLVVEAGAGTGKTTAIVAEVLKLMIEQPGLQPDRIVLMTFTEKAAGEIAERIRTAIEELVDALSVVRDPLSDDARNGQRTTDHGPRIGWPTNSPNPLVTIADPDAAHRALREQLSRIDALRSQTIHSFCQSLLRTFPIEAGLDPQFKIIEGFERSLLYGQLYDAWVDEETRVEARPEIVAEWELLFEHVGYFFMIRELVFALLDRRDLLNETAYDFGAFEEVESQLIDAITVVRRTDDEAGDEHARRVFAYLRASMPPSDLDGWIKYLQPVNAGIREANLPKHNVLKEALRVLRAGDKGRSIYDRLVSHRAAMALLAMTRRFIDFLDREKRKLGVVDFDDLLLRTLSLLDDDVVLERARGQFDFIFVDEFQDTDRTQARIIEKLARGADGRYVPGRTIVVGDPKQSIYGFRRADPETYDAMTRDLERGGAERRILGDQYRSDPPLLDAVNAMFACLFPESERDPNVFRPPYHPLRAGRAKNARELDARVTLLQAETEEKSDRYFGEAEAIAEWIRLHRDGGERDLQRFAILFRRLTKLDDYLDTFERHGIDYVLPPTRLFLDRRAPVDLLAVLRAIGYEFDRGAKISAARTPYFGLTDDEIVGAGEVWSRFEETLARFREASRHLTVSSLVDLIVETTGIERVYDAAADGVRHQRHLEHVRAIAYEYDRSAGGSVRQFVDEIARRRAEPDEMEPSLADESRNAVRILSVHAAKGLEFETVILPDLVFPSSNPDAMQLFTVEEPRSLVLAGRAESISANFRLAGGEKLKKISGLREEAEMRRLFYVAVTRAKSDVVFVCNTDEPKNAGFLKCLLEVLGSDRATFASLWPAAGREVKTMPVGGVELPVAFEKVDVRETSARARHRLRDAALEDELARAEIVPLELPVPSHDPRPLTPAQVAAQRAGARNKAAGTLLHRVLELWDGRADVAPLLGQLAAESAADAESVARVRQRLATISRSPMLQRIARAETVGRELTIRFVEDHALVERRIDRLLREDAHDVVIDYKSGTPEPRRVDRDRLQVKRYCDAVTRMTGRACRGVLWYVDLERDEVVEV